MSRNRFESKNTRNSEIWRVEGIPQTLGVPSVSLDARNLKQSRSFENFSLRQSLERSLAVSKVWKMTKIDRSKWVGGSSGGDLGVHSYVNTYYRQSEARWWRRAIIGGISPASRRVLISRAAACVTVFNDVTIITMIADNDNDNW